eukprot:TRINITY_DN12099_c0_g1_i2.p1 TRINITY_DN12099_c0_g1~~TRINITY_DN12099_c0_g1_i2.p1  ORF type:complete len:179 (-),score=40.84 TRINITY_DN12099_c0_g1_i2:452-925(-)
MHPLRHMASIFGPKSKQFVLVASEIERKSEDFGFSMAITRSIEGRTNLTLLKGGADKAIMMGVKHMVDLPNSGLIGIAQSPSENVSTFGEICALDDGGNDMDFCLVKVTTVVKESGDKNIAQLGVYDSDSPIEIYGWNMLPFEEYCKQSSELFPCSQ